MDIWTHGQIASEICLSRFFDQLTSYSSASVVCCCVVIFEEKAKSIVGKVHEGSMKGSNIV